MPRMRKTKTRRPALRGFPNYHLELLTGSDVNRSDMPSIVVYVYDGRHEPIELARFYGDTAALDAVAYTTTMGFALQNVKPSDELRASGAKTFGALADMMARDAKKAAPKKMPKSATAKSATTKRRSAPRKRPAA